ncbi:Os07g0461950, partial [Oryza sativa Japonica Group]
DGGLVGLRAGVGEEDAVREGGLHEALGERHLGDGVLDVAGVDEGGGLGGDGGDPVGVGVAERVDGDAGGHVEVLAPVGVVQLAAAAGDEDDAGAVVRPDDVPRLVLHHGAARGGQLAARG